MKTKLYRRVGGKHVKFNISKSGVSTSIKLGPITINPQRNTYSINTPIKGLSLRGNLVNKEANNRVNDNRVNNRVNNNRVKLEGIDYFLPFFTELRQSLVSNEFDNLVPYTDTLISECSNEKGVDVSLFADTVKALEKGLRECDAEVDECIYNLLGQFREAFDIKLNKDDIGALFMMATIIVITVSCLLA